CSNWHPGQRSCLRELVYDGAHECCASRCENHKTRTETEIPISVEHQKYTGSRYTGDYRLSLDPYLHRHDSAANRLLLDRFADRLVFRICSETMGLSRRRGNGNISQRTNRPIKGEVQNEKC